MVGMPEENVKKEKFTLTLNPDLVGELKTELKIDNLSGWVNERIREALLERRLVWECICGATAGRVAWERWLLICPTCKADHARLDRRKRIKLEG